MPLDDWQKRLISPLVIVLLIIVVTVNPSIASISASPYLDTTHQSSQSLSSVHPKDTEKMRNSSSSSTFKITYKLKSFINTLADANKTNGAIAVGLIDSNGTQIYGHGKISSNSNTTVDENTIFVIGSITKVFTTTLLSNMVNQCLVKLDDPIEKYILILKIPNIKKLDYY